MVKNAKTLLFWAAAAPPLVHQSMLLYCCPVCRSSENCQICKPFLWSSWFAQNPILPGAVFIQQNEPHETNFLLPLSQLPENPCCYSTGQCCSPLRTVRARNRFPALIRSFVHRTIFWNLEFWSKTAKRSFFGPLLLRHWCTNPCCSTTAQFVFLVRVTRYANHFSSHLGSPKIPLCRVQFLSSRTSRMRLMFCSHSANFPKIHAALLLPTVFLV